MKPLLLCAALLMLSLSAWPQTMWQLQTTANGFNWIAPLGTGQSNVCKYAAVSLVDTGLISRSGQWLTLIPDKYPTYAAWAAAQNDRLKSWGFTVAGQYSYRFAANTPPGGLPNTWVIQASGWLLRDQGPIHVKSLYGNYSGQVCGSRYYGPDNGGQADPFDPNFSSGLQSSVLAQWNGCGGPCINDKNILVIIEEADHLFGLDSLNPGGNHADLGVVVIDANPVQNHIPDGAFTFTDKLLYAKTAARDFLANEYGCSGSADPAASNYCGRHRAARALAALNATWFGGTFSYTTWNTSDAGGIAGIHAGTYSSYGAGTGLLDENGTHTISAAFKSSCHNFPTTNWSYSPQIETDMHAFVGYFTTIYSQGEVGAWSQSGVNPHPPLFMPFYDGPNYVYTAAAPYFDGFYVSVNHPETSGLTYTQEVERIIAASSVPGGKSMPLLIADYSTANPDSYWPTSTGGQPQYTLQRDKGNGEVTNWSSVLPLRDVNGMYTVVGIEHWGLYSESNEFYDGGMVTSYADNPLDGGASNAIATQSTTWTPSHTYPAPSLIWDGTNYEALSNNITMTCVSGGTTPAWAPKMGSTTTDGTCTWRNEGPYPLRPETGIPGSATIPNVAFGDAITPVANFLNAGICDPGTR